MHIKGEGTGADADASYIPDIDIMYKAHIYNTFTYVVALGPTN